MRIPGLEGDTWPSGADELALRAALLDGSRAVGAWEALVREHGPDLTNERLAGANPEAFRLLALVQHNLRPVLPDDARLEPLVTLAKHNWYRTRKIVDSAGPALDRLAAAGIATMVLKGTPLALAYYDNPGLRFLSDVDLMVPYADAARALELLAASGWAPMTVTPRRRALRAGHSQGLHHPEFGTLDLHWRMSMALAVGIAGDGSARDVWRAAEPLEVSGRPTTMPGPEDLLLHVCVHGAWRQSGATARWVADACTIIRRAHDRLDWDRLVAKVAGRQIAMRIRNDMAYLARTFDAPVPERVLVDLHALPVSGRERRTYRAMTREPPTNEYTRRLAVVHGYWLEKMGAAPRWRQVYELPGYLQEVMQLEHLWEVPLELSARLRNELRRRPSRPAPGVARDAP
jgi:hypothetical protein